MQSSYDLFYALKQLDYLKTKRDPLWWPNSGTFEVLVGALLTQQTKWERVEESLENLKAQCPLCSNNLGKYCSKEGCEATDCIDACEPDCSWKAVSDTFDVLDCESRCIKCVEALEAQENNLKEIINQISRKTKEELSKDYLKWRLFRKQIYLLPKFAEVPYPPFKYRRNQIFRMKKYQKY